MKLIPLINRKQEIIAYTKIDDEDFEKVNAIKWRKADGWGDTIYAATTIYKNGEQYHLLLHRFLMSANNDMEVDHINRDRLDNQRSNLRLVSHKQNQENRKMDCRNKSGFRGVNFHKGVGKWRAFITQNNKHIHVGYYNDPILAHNAVKAKRIELGWINSDDTEVL